MISICCEGGGLAGWLPRMGHGQILAVCSVWDSSGRFAGSAGYEMRYENEVLMKGQESELARRAEAGTSSSGPNNVRKGRLEAAREMSWSVSTTFRGWSKPSATRCDSRKEPSTNSTAFLERESPKVPKCILYNYGLLYYKNAFHGVLPAFSKRYIPAGPRSCTSIARKITFEIYIFLQSVKLESLPRKRHKVALAVD